MSVPSLELGPPPPLPQASVLTHGTVGGGGGTHSPACEGVGCPNSDDWRDSLVPYYVFSVLLCTVCIGSYFNFYFILWQEYVLASLFAWRLLDFVGLYRVINVSTGTIRIKLPCFSSQFWLLHTEKQKPECSCGINWFLFLFRSFYEFLSESRRRFCDQNY